MRQRYPCIGGPLDGQRVPLRLSDTTISVPLMPTDAPFGGLIATSYETTRYHVRPVTITWAVDGEERERFFLEFMALVWEETTDNDLQQRLARMRDSWESVELVITRLGHAQTTPPLTLPDYHLDRTTEDDQTWD